MAAGTFGRRHEWTRWDGEKQKKFFYDLFLVHNGIVSSTHIVQSLSVLHDADSSFSFLISRVGILMLAAAVALRYAYGVD